jgi:glycosyltransferase involved in cell wall biosynthesis
MIPESDGTPNTALEAMVSKVPVLLGKAAYDETLFSKNWVWRLSENSTKQLLEKLLEIRNSETEFLQKRLTQAQNIVISNASLDRAIDKINSLYANFG